MGVQACQQVKIRASAAGAVFAFRLSQQQDGEFDGIWMTDAVVTFLNGLSELAECGCDRAGNYAAGENDPVVSVGRMIIKVRLKRTLLN